MPVDSLAICAVIQNEGRYLEEWIAFHILQGVSEFVLYDDGSDDHTSQILERIGRFSKITIIPWKFPGGTFDAWQQHAYADCVARLAGQVDYVAFIDIDEFLFSRNGGGLPRALSNFTKEISAIAVNQRIFGSAALTEDDGGLVTSRFIHCTTSDHHENHWFKSIARLGKIKAIESVHSVLPTDGLYVLNDGQSLVRNGPFPGLAAHVGEGDICLHHYMLKSLSEYRTKQKRWAGKGMEERFGESYFFDRDSASYANAVTNDILFRYERPIEDMILKLIFGPAPAEAA
jgi:glycosyltransferase involved in cell wall biosynthesis